MAAVDKKAEVIVVRKDGKRNDIFPLTTNTCTFGRAEENDIRLHLPHVSKRHCKITFRKDGLAFIENFSDNGTQVNDVWVTRRTILNNKDKISLCGRHFLFVYAEKGKRSPLMDHQGSNASVYTTPHTPPSVKPHSSHDDDIDNSPTTQSLKRKLSFGSQVKAVVEGMSPARKARILELMQSPAPLSRKGTEDKADRLKPARKTEAVDTLRMLTEQANQERRSGSTPPPKTPPKRSQAPNSVKSARKVTFGPPLSPEVFDKDHPSSTPVKRGKHPAVSPQASRTPTSALKRRTIYSNNVEPSIEAQEILDQLRMVNRDIAKDGIVTTAALDSDSDEDADATMPQTFSKNQALVDDDTTLTLASYSEGVDDVTVDVGQQLNIRSRGHASASDSSIPYGTHADGLNHPTTFPTQAELPDPPSKPQPPISQNNASAMQPSPNRLSSVSTSMSAALQSNDVIKRRSSFHLDLSPLKAGQTLAEREEVELVVKRLGARLDKLMAELSENRRKSDIFPYYSLLRDNELDAGKTKVAEQFLSLSGLPLSSPLLKRSRRVLLPEEPEEKASKTEEEHQAPAATGDDEEAPTAISVLRRIRRYSSIMKAQDLQEEPKSAPALRRLLYKQDNPDDKSAADAPRYARPTTSSSFRNRPLSSLENLIRDTQRARRLSAGEDVHHKDPLEDAQVTEANTSNTHGKRKENTPLTDLASTTSSEEDGKGLATEPQRLKRRRTETVEERVTRQRVRV
ncbi:hypothetical protein BZG36_00324 [Bifiguratus adelaidae]|uniref:FHA domain-containing protein n=1 Tax=Bifiguratus adelaidae TaxID=1938954 RepID=A0A261Y7T7_9FUNG|nr:hypothetical protein BZG36_00324 [Bifiguratus adelaidae]